MILKKIRKNSSAQVSNQDTETEEVTNRGEIQRESTLTTRSRSQWGETFNNLYSPTQQWYFWTTEASHNLIYVYIHVDEDKKQIKKEK